jgi:hypothetical protein
MTLHEPTLAAVEFVTANMREDDRREAHATRWDSDDQSLAREIVSYDTRLGWVAAWDGKPVAVIGSVQMWPNIWSCYMLATDDIRHIGKSLTKFARHGMIPAIKELGGHRGEARSMAGHVVAHKWLETLGAVREGTLAAYGKGGEDFIVFAWTLR